MPVGTAIGKFISQPPRRSSLRRSPPNVLRSGSAGPEIDALLGLCADLGGKRGAETGLTKKIHIGSFDLSAKLLEDAFSKALCRLVRIEPVIIPQPIGTAKTHQQSFGAGWRCA